LIETAKAYTYSLISHPRSSHKSEPLRSYTGCRNRWSTASDTRKYIRYV